MQNDEAQEGSCSRNEKMGEHAKHDVVKVTKNQLDFHEDENEIKEMKCPPKIPGALKH